MSDVKRVYVEKKRDFAVAAQGLSHEIRSYLGVNSLKNVRILIRYDVENISQEVYEKACRMQDLVKDSDSIIHHTFDAGEGVLIPGEILHHAKHGCEAFVILQPFGCLPNHVVGRGIVKKLKELYPNVQILPLDYDPDVSFANIENRLQMLVMNVRAGRTEKNKK